jgi:Na+/H+ antiporter NhaD/arsenite permease-like protein
MSDLGFERLIALVALGGTYLGLALGRLPFLRVDRTGVAIIGGALVVVSGLLPWDRAVAAVDAHTLVLLFGMMIVAAYLRLSGFFRLVTYAAVRRAPIVLDLARRLRLPPVPYLVALATAANVGSVATLTGNPQNMLVGSFSGISYRAFLLREAPVALIGLAIVFAVIWLAYRRRLPPALPTEAIAEPGVVHRALMIKTVAAVSVMLVAFLAGVPIALVAIGGAAYCLLTRRVNPDKVYREIDWGLLVLFTGLFVVIGGVEASGLAGQILDAAAAVGLSRPAVLTAVTAVLSNLVSNVPAVLLFKTVIPTFGEPARAWLLLAMASTLAGNLTILGSVANLIVVEQARGAGIRIGFLEYSRVGVPVTALTLLVGWLLLIN